MTSMYLSLTTGKPTREFLHLNDAADGILMAAERYEGSDSVNLGLGLETSIESLAHLIGRLTGFKGRFRWATGKFGLRARVSFESGLCETVDWYKKHARP